MQAWLENYHAAQALGTVYSENDRKIMDFARIAARECWSVVPVAGLCIVVDRPCLVATEEIAHDGAWRLHNGDGPAIAFRDGWAVWSWHGVLLPPDIIGRREQLTPATIATLANAEQRRAAIEIYGLDRYMPDCGGRVIDSSAYGKLWHRDLGGGEEPYRAIEVLNGSLEPDGTRKTYFLPVPAVERTPRGGTRQLDTALKAVAWTYGLTAKEYARLAVRT